MVFLGDNLVTLLYRGYMIKIFYLDNQAPYYGYNEEICTRIWGPETVYKLQVISHIKRMILDNLYELFYRLTYKANIRIKWPTGIEPA